MIRHFVPKAPPPHKAGPTLEILIAGACELLFLGVAPHAAVDAANRLAQGDAKAVHFKGLINAVLRRVAREGAGLVASQDAAGLNTPDWLWPRWVSHYGEGHGTGARPICPVASILPSPPLLERSIFRPAGEGISKKAKTISRSRLAADPALASTLPQREDGANLSSAGAVQILAPGRLRLTDAGRIEELSGFSEEAGGVLRKFRRLACPCNCSETSG